MQWYVFSALSIITCIIVGIRIIPVVSSPFDRQGGTAERGLDSQLQATSHADTFSWDRNTKRVRSTWLGLVWSCFTIIYPSHPRLSTHTHLKFTEFLQWPEHPSRWYLWNRSVCPLVGWPSQHSSAPVWSVSITSRPLNPSPTIVTFCSRNSTAKESGCLLGVI